MEVSRTTYRFQLVRFHLAVLLAGAVFICAAQPTVKTYTIKNGKMYIELSKKISNASLDSFTAQYNLTDLPLKQMVKANNGESLKKLGWKIEQNTEEKFIISKPLFSVNNINNPGQKIIFTQKQPGVDDIFPENIGKIIYGFNRFKNKYSFEVNGSLVTFFLRNNSGAKEVRLAGTFTNWITDALPMNKRDSGWIVQVKLNPGKHWYKFIIDGNWSIDNDNMLRENDGRGNMNSVFYKTNFTFKLDGFFNSRKVYVAGSFNNWRPADLLMLKSNTGWQLPLYLAKGTYTYKFVSDGEWITDPKNEDRLPDGRGGYNAVIQIGSPYIFKLNGYTNARQVKLMGSFNSWHNDELLMRRTATGWEYPYTLGPGNYEYKFIVDGREITDPDNPRVTNNTRNKGNSFLVIEPNYTFRLKGFNTAKNIFIAGDFNNWNPNTLPMKPENDMWSVDVNLAPGKHLYKFIIDGKWIIDPANKLWERNEYGTGNSVLWIERYL